MNKLTKIEYKSLKDMGEIPVYLYDTHIKYGKWGINCGQFAVQYLSAFSQPGTTLPYCELHDMEFYIYGGVDK